MSSLAPRIAYFGLPLGALALLHAGYAPRVVVLGHTDGLGTRRLRRRLHAGVTVLTRPSLHDASALQAIEQAAPDVILSWFYPKQIPERLLRLASRGAFGTHPSLLPRWRGPDPYFWALYRGDAETGVSLHRLERAYDTGPVIAQEKLAITADDDAWRLAKRLDRPALRLLVECARRLHAGEELAGSAQDEALASDAPAPDEALLAIDWTHSADEIVRLVRAAAPYPGASCELGDELVEVVRARRYEPELPRALAPAEAVETPLGLVVRAGDRGVLVERVRRESGELLIGAQLRALFAHGLARVGFSAANSAKKNG